MIGRLAGLLAVAAIVCPGGAMAYDVVFEVDNYLAADISAHTVDPAKSVNVSSGNPDHDPLSVTPQTSGMQPSFHSYEVRLTAKGNPGSEHCAFSAQVQFLGTSGWGCTINPVRTTPPVQCSNAMTTGWTRSKPCSFRLRIEPR